MPIYTIGIIQFDDLLTVPSGGGTPQPFDFTTTNTTGSVVADYEFQISASATPVTLSIEDDDPDFDDGFIDFPNNSTAGNNQLLSAPVTVNGVAYGPATMGDPPSAQVELEFGFSTTDGQTFYVVRIDGVNVGLTGTVLPQPGQVIEVDTAFDGQEEPYVSVPCFTAGTWIDTAAGPRRVESLRQGDLISTIDSGPQPLHHLTISEISLPELLIRPSLRPIEIMAGAFGNTRALFVSPQHGILVRGAAAEIHFGAPEVLVPAKALAGGRRARIAPLTRAVTYVHLIFQRHHLLCTEGMISESFWPGGNLAAAQEFRAIFGAVPDPVPAPVPPVRPFLRVSEARALAI
ncbi:MAG: Hint domain-containing protein [Pseudomonadota bacterium]